MRFIHVLSLATWLLACLAIARSGACLAGESEEGVAVSESTVPVAPVSFKGLAEALQIQPLPWAPDAHPVGELPSFEQAMLTPPAKGKLGLGPVFEPTLLLRSLFVTTQEDTVYNQDGSVAANTTDLRRTYFGHREGFVLENVELGFKGRLNESGLYYSAKLEMVPREKDGTKSEGDYLKEVYAGWNYYSVFDVRFGRIKIPFSQASLRSSTDQPTVYAPILDSLLPKRMVGANVMFADPWQIARLYGGVFNSVKEPHEQMSKLSQLLWAGRLELRPDLLLDVLGARTGDFFNLRLGGSFGYAEENYDPRTEMRYLGVDVHLDLSIVTVEAELLFKDYYGEGTESALARRGIGWHAELVLHAWPTVLDMVARVEQADNNDDNVVVFADIAQVVLDQEKRWLTFGLLLHVTRQIDVAVNYVHRTELEGYEVDNDMLLTLLQVNL